ncbi:MAG: hypothetical protein SGPRY_010116 [Prymnesium sp.]
MVEKIFRQSAEFCSEHEVWVLNVAHETKFREAIRYYEPTVKKHSQNILGVPAIVLANLCVAYIMTSQNEEAEELMRRVEREEESVEPDKQTFHLCIINLHMIMLKDATFAEILSFLDAIDSHGKNIPTKVQDHPDKPIDTARYNVSFESRTLKKMFLKLRG